MVAVPAVNDDAQQNHRLNQRELGEPADITPIVSDKKHQGKGQGMASVVGTLF